jgi:hypothetical protein
MAFHLHQIDALLDYVPAAALQLPRNVRTVSPAASRLSLRWQLENDGCLRAPSVRD